MQTAALIVAAGMSSKMGDFKPMLTIGSISVAQRIVNTFKQVGVDKLVMVTGYNATMLQRHLAGNNMVFLKNDNYKTTQMFDSAVIGLQYLRDKCDRVLFTPVDIPLFTASTVSALTESDAQLACPVCDGIQGHPIMISSGLIDRITSDNGEGGLHGALSRCECDMVEIPVSDAGILHDADTQEDYQSLLQYHNSQLIRPVIHVELSKERPFFDEKIAMLLSLVDETHSVRTACKRMQISYSTGWNIIHTLESQLPFSLIERNQGGAGGGQSNLTAEGVTLLRQYGEYEKKLRQTASELFNEYFDGDF